MESEDDTTISCRSGLMQLKSSKEKKIAELVIEAKMVPYMLSFNYTALCKLTLASEPPPSPLTAEIFDFLKKRLVISRFTDGSTIPSRMKAEEKVKFLLRSFDHKVGVKSVGKPIFNVREQMIFFARADVQLHFHKVIDQALTLKKAENRQRTDQLADCIRIALSTEPRDEQRARKIFVERIKRKQLPWTDNMFHDMRIFADHLYSRMIRLLEERKRLGLPPIESVRPKKQEDEHKEEEVEAWAVEEEEEQEMEHCKQ